MIKNKTDKDRKITPYTYAFIIAGLHFCIINHQLSEISEKWDHDKDDIEAIPDWKFWTSKYRQEQKKHIMQLYLKALLPSQKKDSEILDFYTKKLKQLIKQHKNEEENKSNSSDIPLSLKVFVNSFQIFLHDLWYMTPDNMNEK